MKQYNTTLKLIILLLFLGYFSSVSASVNPDGSFGHSIPIEIPGGTNGLQPRLSLVYNSNAGNGIVGLGWKLQGLASFSRDVSLGVNYDDSDGFVGPSGRLIHKSGNDYYYENVAKCKKGCVC